MKTDFEAMGGSYHWEGDYLIPDVAVPEMPNVGIWGKRRKQGWQEQVSLLKISASRCENFQ